MRLAFNTSRDPKDSDVRPTVCTVLHLRRRLSHIHNVRETVIDPHIVLTDKAGLALMIAVTITLTCHA